MTRFFCAADTCACSIPISVPQHHIHKASIHKASHSIKQRTSSILVSNQECICTIQYLHLSRMGYLSEHISIVTLIFKACIPDKRGNQHALFYTGDPYLSLSLSLFLFSFCHSIISIIIITEHGALLTGHGSWMASSVNVVPPIPIPM